MNRSVAPMMLVVALAVGGGCGSSGTPSRDAGNDAGSFADATPDALPDAAGVDAPADAAAEAAFDAAVDASPDVSGDVVLDGARDAADAEAGADGPSSLPNGTPWRALAISTGITHACALLDNHQVKCWGANVFACLGTGDGDDRGNVPEKMGNGLPFVNLGAGRSAVAISAGRYTTCAILDTGDVKCWGFRAFTGAPEKPADDAFAGNQPGDLGDALPTLDLGGHKATHLASGYNSTCATLDDGNARCWGGGAPVTSVALLPPLGVRQLASAWGRVAVLFDDGTLSNIPSGNMSLTLPTGRTATYVAGSETGICAVLDDAHLVCTDRVGARAARDEVRAVDVGYGHSCVLAKSGDVRCWGGDCAAYPNGTKYACPGPALADASFAVPLGQPATALGTAGYDFSCALLTDGGVKCWTTYDTCTNAAGGSDVCAVPDGQVPTVVGGAVAMTGAGKTRKFGAWGEIDFGTRP